MRETGTESPKEAKVAELREVVASVGDWLGVALITQATLAEEERESERELGTLGT